MALRQPNRSRGPRPPLDAEGLDRLAIAYVGRYATTRAKLIAYLKRKVGERGAAPGVDPVAVADRVVALGYVDDAAFAATRADALARRGFGVRRVDLALRAVGIDADVRGEAIAPAAEDPMASALAFARRKRLGPWAAVRAVDRDRERALAAFARAGHAMAVARTLVDREPGDMPDEERN